MAAPLAEAEDYDVGRLLNAADSLSARSIRQEKSRKVHLEILLSSRPLYRLV
jgi:hypothetical protein